MKRVVCPGSFDPITNGHLEIIKRASKMFDNVTVLVANNVEKSGFFTPEEKVELIQRVLDSEPTLENVDVQLFSGLLVEYIEKNKITALVKGLRAVSDFEYEFQMALINRKLYNECETVFIPASSDNMYLSSSIVKQVGELGGDITHFLPPCVCEDIIKKIKG